MSITFAQRAQEAQHQSLSRRLPEILQINVGKLCNQTCSHCHVDAGPNRTEVMTEDDARACLRLLDEFPTIHTLDLTGGAPELNPVFRMLASEGRGRGLNVIDRCNLTVLLLPGQEDLVEFLSSNKISIIASLPCYLEENVNKQRGRDVFKKSIEALRNLNNAGYGRHEDLRLDLVYNPVGLGLPPAQAALEADYRKHLGEEYGIEFTSLLTITNMPVSRFERFLKAMGQYEAYLQKLENAFNPATVAELMCRNTLNVGWDGYVYDCDFNQMLDLKLGNGEFLHVNKLTRGEWLAQDIRTDRHCFGCTAGSGSSCGGSLA